MPLDPKDKRVVIGLLGCVGLVLAMAVVLPRIGTDEPQKKTKLAPPDPALKYVKKGAYSAAREASRAAKGGHGTMGMISEAVASMEQRVKHGGRSELVTTDASAFQRSERPDHNWSPMSGLGASGSPSRSGAWMAFDSGGASGGGGAPRGEGAGSSAGAAKTGPPRTGGKGAPGADPVSVGQGVRPGASAIPKFPSLKKKKKKGGAAVLLSSFAGGKKSRGGGHISEGGSVEQPKPKDAPVYHYVKGKVVDVYSPDKELPSKQTKVVNNKEMKLGTQLLAGEKVSVTGPPTDDGYVPVYIPGQNMTGYVPAEQLSLDRGLAKNFPVRQIDPQPGPSGKNPLREAFVEETAKLEGVPYVWGGRSPKGVDCSGMVQLAASYVGMGDIVPRVSRHQKAASKPVHPRDLKRGDLVFTAKTSSKERKVSHVVVYLGDGMIREAPRTGLSVMTRPFAKRFGVAPEQIKDYDDNKGVRSGKYYLFFGTFFQDPPPEERPAPQQ